MILVAIDTSTPSTVTGVLLPGGGVVEARDDPAPGSRGDHAARVLVLLEEAMGRAAVEWDEVERVVVGVGPGGFTGLRIGIATARALAQGRGLPLAGVGSLAALAAGAGPGGDAVAAVIDARRGEAFAGVWRNGRELVAPAAIGPGPLAERLARLGNPVRAVGDGAVRFRAELEEAGVAIPPDDSPVHRVSAGPLCRLGSAAVSAPPGQLLPDYRREPDAKPPR